MNHIYQWLLNDPVKFLTSLVAACSVLHTVLPPWDWKPQFVEEGLADFPWAQTAFYGVFHNRWYKLLIYVVGYVALNGRSTVWRVLSISNQQGLNKGLTGPSVAQSAAPVVTKSEQTVNPVPEGGKVN